MLPLDDCGDCKPAYLRRSLDSVPPSAIALSSIPFAVTWIAVAILAQRRLFPALTGGLEKKGDAQDELPVFDKGVFQSAKRSNWRGIFRRPSAQRLAQLVFSTSIGLSAVLVELLLCEISNTLNPAVRGLALKIVLGSLMMLIIVVTPALETHGIANGILGAPSDSTSTRQSRPKLRAALGSLLLKAWLLVFWYIPQASILRTSLHDKERGGHAEDEHAFIEGCLERIGIIGISLMASLAGFAAVSSLWQTFGVRHREVKDSDISRKAAGLSATEEMLSAKQSRLRALERKLSEQTTHSEQKGLVGRMIGSIRGPPSSTQELSSLRMEISGLSTMHFTLRTSLHTLRTRHTAQTRSKTPQGRLLNLANLLFALYCAYRILATLLSILRRHLHPSPASFATTDPINNILALLTTHWNPNLDRVAWSHQISFLLSGIMLLAAFSAVLQTFRVFARFAPALVQHAQTSLPLIISQIAGTYVISSALLLRTNLPEDVSGVITEALGAPLESRFVEGWFESWFLVAVGVTALGIFLGRKVSGSYYDDEEDYWDDDGGMEMGKRS